MNLPNGIKGQGCGRGPVLLRVCLSVEDEVAVDLPVADMGAVGVP